MDVHAPVGASTALTDMAMGRVFKDPYGQINSIDFHRTQDFLVAGHDAGIITVYSTYEGKKLTTLDCSKYGVAHLRFTHHAKCVVHASTKDSSIDKLAKHAVRYLSHHDNRYLRFFKGHTDRVTSLSMSPKTDQVMSTAVDKKLFMWDLRTSQAQAVMDIPGQPFAAMDEEGLVFAASCNGGVISMFDARAYEHGPFLAFPLPVTKYQLPPTAPVACMKFSSHQQHLLVTVENRMFLMDTFTGDEILSWATGAPEAGLPMEASFSCDGKYVLTGSANKNIYIYQCPDGGADVVAQSPDLYSQPVKSWPSHPGMPTCAKWSPNRKLAVTACHALVMWIPNSGNV